MSYVAAALETIRAALASNLPTRLNTVEAAESVTLTDPIAYQTTQDVEAPTDVLTVKVVRDGAARHTHWLTADDYVELPFAVLYPIVDYTADTTVDALADHYSEAIVNCLTAMAMSGAMSWITIRESLVTPNPLDTRQGRAVIVRATAHLITARAVS